MKRAASSILALILLAAPALAQDVQPLTETFTVEGNWSVAYPAGWVTDVNALPFLATSDDAVATMQENAPLPEGGIAIGIVPPDAYPLLGLTFENSAEATIALLAGFFGGATAIEQVQGASMTAFATPLIGTTRVPADSHLLVFETGGTVFAFLVAVADFEAALPLLLAIAESVEVEG